MARFYLMNQPLRMTMTGHIHLPGHIRRHFPGVTYTSLCLNNYTDFGLLEGSGLKLSEALTFCAKSFNVERIFEDEFVGALCLYWDEEKDPETGEVTKTLKQLLDEFSVSYTDDGSGNIDKVYHAKRFKKKEFKQICKNEFNDYNDLIANVSKSMMLLNEYRDGLNSAQQTRLDNVLTAMKSIYDIDTCLDAMEADVSNISTIMPDYYTAKSNLDNLTTLDDIRNATYK